MPISEEATLRSAFGPEGAAYDKTGVEDVLTGALEDVTILRLPVIYGWPDATRISQRLDPMLDGVKRIEMTEGLARFRMSRGLGQNVAHAIVLAARSARAGRRIYNVAEGEALSELDWTLRIAAACGWRGEIDVVPGKGPVQDLVVSSARIRSELGYREVADPGTGLAEAVAFHAFTRRGMPYRKCY